MKKHLSIIIIISIFVIALGMVITCTGNQGAPDAFISGTISGPVGEDNVVVVLFDNEKREYNKNTIKKEVKAENNWKYNINVDYGNYVVCAFIDDNNDFYFTMGEKWGCNENAANITKSSTNAERNVSIKK
jgi:uncharacterized membrane protein